MSKLDDEECDEAPFFAHGVEYIFYSPTFQSIRGYITALDGPWVRVSSEDADHIFRISDVTHIKVIIRGGDNADL